MKGGFGKQGPFTRSEERSPGSGPVSTAGTRPGHVDPACSHSWLHHPLAPGSPVRPGGSCLVTGEGQRALPSHAGDIACARPRAAPVGPSSDEQKMVKISQKPSTLNTQDREGCRHHPAASSLPQHPASGGVAVRGGQTEASWFTHCPDSHTAFRA